MAFFRQIFAERAKAFPQIAADVERRDVGVAAALGGKIEAAEVAAPSKAAKPAKVAKAAKK